MLSWIAVPLTSIFKILENIKSTTRPKKGRIRVDGDGGDNGGHNNEYTSRLRTSALTDLSTDAAQVKVQYNEVGGDGSASSKLVKKLSKSQRIVRKSKEPQKLEKSAKSIGLEEPSFLNSDTRLIVAKKSLVKTQYKTHDKELLTIVVAFKD